MNRFVFGIQCGKARSKGVVRRRYRRRRVFRVVLAPQSTVKVDVLLEGESRVEHLFHGIESVGFDVPLDLPRMARSMFDDLLLGPFEQEIVLGKIRVTEYVRRDQRVIGKAVAGRQVCTPRVARKHHFEQS